MIETQYVVLGCIILSWMMVPLLFGTRIVGGSARRH